MVFINFTIILHCPNLLTIKKRNDRIISKKWEKVTKNTNRKKRRKNKWKKQKNLSQLF